MLFYAEETPEGQTEEIKRRGGEEKKWKEKEKGAFMGYGNGQKEERRG